MQQYENFKPRAIQTGKSDVTLVKCLFLVSLKIVCFIFLALMISKFEKNET